MGKYSLKLMFLLSYSVCPFLFATTSIDKCTKNGGSIKYQHKEHQQYQVCIFDDNRQCEIKALNHGWCPVGGVKITGYDNQEQIYCAIRGGKVLAVKNATCTLPDGQKFLLKS